MLAKLAADLIVWLHFSFILFVVFGALLVLRWRKLICLHLPAVIWGVWIEFSGWVCPLTPLENRFRHIAGEAGYKGGFIENHLLPVIYPEALSRELQLVSGFGVILVNLLIYAWLYRRWKASQN